MDEENIREPIPAYTDNLFDNNIYNESYDEFKKRVNKDNSIDKRLKKVLLQSREDYITKDKNKQKKIEKRKNQINNIINLIDNKLKLLLNDKINKYINLEIDTIELDYDIYNEIEEIIKKMSNIEREKMLEIFMPYDKEGYLDYLEVIRISKDTYDIENKVKEEREKQELYIKEESTKRTNILSKLILNINKLYTYDTIAKNLKDNLEPLLHKYINCELDIVLIDINLYEYFDKFIKNIRIEDNIKIQIKNIINQIK